MLAVETFAPAEKDLGINWVDWNPCVQRKQPGIAGPGTDEPNRPWGRMAAAGGGKGAWMVRPRRIFEAFKRIFFYVMQYIPGKKN